MGATNEQILSAILDLKQDMGEVKSIARNAHEFAAAVSKKADIVRQELQAHAGSSDAHGAGGERRGKSELRAAVIAVLGGICSSIAVFKFVTAAGAGQ